MLDLYVFDLLTLSHTGTERGDIPRYTHRVRALNCFSYCLMLCSHISLFWADSKCNPNLKKNVEHHRQSHREFSTLGDKKKTHRGSCLVLRLIDNGYFQFQRRGFTKNVVSQSKKKQTNKTSSKEKQHIDGKTSNQAFTASRKHDWNHPVGENKVNTRLDT